MLIAIASMLLNYNVVVTIRHESSIVASGFIDQIFYNQSNYTQALSRN